MDSSNALGTFESVRRSPSSSTSSDAITRVPPPQSNCFLSSGLVVSIDLLWY
jgi:hypothetical protein